MSSASRGLAPREGLELGLMKMGRAGPPPEPRHRPQAGKSRDPRSQNADTFPWFIRPGPRCSLCNGEAGSAFLRSLDRWW